MLWIGILNLPPDDFDKIPTTALCNFFNQLNTARRFMWNKVTSAQAAVAVFAFNVYGQEISFSIVFQAVILALLLSIGTAGVKGAPMVMSTVLLETFGLPLDLIAILGAIWPVVDWCNTATNVTGDVVGTAIVAKQLNLIDEDSPLLK